MPDHINPTVGPDHEEVDQWRTTSSTAASRPSGTPSTGARPRPAGRELYYEELMGEEGFSSDSSLLYHRNIPSTIVGRRACGRAARPVDDPQPPADAAPPQAARPLRRQGRHGDRRRHRTPARARQRRRADLLRRRRRAKPVVPQRHRRRVRLHRARQGPRRDGVRRLRGRPRATTSSSRGRRRTAGSPRRSDQGPAARLLHRGQQPHRAAEALPQQVRPAPRARPVLRARPAPAGGPLLAEDVGAGADEQTEVYIKHRGNGPGGIVGTIHTLPFHPLDVVGWDGCLYPYVFNVA